MRLASSEALFEYRRSCDALGTLIGCGSPNLFRGSILLSTQFLDLG
jgi:hypothetical protein